MKRLSLLSLLLLTACKDGCELEYDRPRDTFYVWCEGSIAGATKTKEEAIAKWQEYLKHQPSYRVALPLEK